MKQNPNRKIQEFKEKLQRKASPIERMKWKRDITYEDKAEGLDHSIKKNVFKKTTDKNRTYGNSEILFSKPKPTNSKCRRAKGPDEGVPGLLSIALIKHLLKTA